MSSTGQPSHLTGAQGTIEDSYLVDGAGEEAVVAGRTPPNAHDLAGRQVVEIVITRVDPIRETVNVERRIGNPKVSALLDDQVSSLQTLSASARIQTQSFARRWREKRS